MAHGALNWALCAGPSANPLTPLPANVLTIPSAAILRMRLLKGQAVAVGRRSPLSLYDFNLATYETGDQFDHSAAVAFIKISSQGLRTQARVQLGAGSDREIRHLVAPTIVDDDSSG